MNTQKTYKFLFSALFIFALTPAFSQFSGGVDLGIPNGDWSNGWGAGLGISARYEAPIQSKLNWTASLGFLSFSGKTYQGNKYSSITLIPITGGIKYYFQQSNKGVYGAADIGLFFASGSGSSTNRVGFLPGLGYRLDKFDFTFRINLVPDFGYVGLRAAYIFPGK